jgi:hypothetical protein
VVIQALVIFQMVNRILVLLLFVMYTSRFKDHVTGGLRFQIGLVEMLGVKQVKLLAVQQDVLLHQQ